MGLGESAALMAAFLWTISSIAWSKVHMSALGMNFVKNFLGSLFFLVHLSLAAWLSNKFVFDSNWTAWGLLSIGGFIGIVVGDTCYFRSLQILGPSRALLMATMAPLFSATLDWLFLKNHPSWLVLLGIVLTVGGISLVVSDRKSKSSIEPLLPGKIKAGITLGVMAAICQAIGGMFSKMSMSVDPNCDPLEAAGIRLLVATLFTLAAVVIFRRVKITAVQTIHKSNFRHLVTGTAIGTWLGIWFSQIAFKELNLGVAATLLTTSPLFAIPVLYFVQGQRTTVVAICGTVIAVTGVYLAVNF